MSWEKLLADRAVTQLPPTKRELDNLRSIVTRSLSDVAAPGLSADARFVIAYDAARTLSLMVVRAAGYRPRSAGAHYHTFAALEATDAAFVAISAYFDGCRIKRNVSEYEFAGGVTDTDAEGLLKGPRKIGKTSLVLEAARRAYSPSLRVVVLDTQEQSPVSAEVFRHLALRVLDAAFATEVGESLERLIHSPAGYREIGRAHV